MENQPKRWAGKAPGIRRHTGALGLPDQAGPLLAVCGLANPRNHCYSNCSRSCGLPDLEAQTRLRLVKKEVTHG